MHARRRGCHPERHAHFLARAREVYLLRIQRRSVLRELDNGLRALEAGARDRDLDRHALSGVRDAIGHGVLDGDVLPGLRTAYSKNEHGHTQGAGCAVRAGAAIVGAVRRDDHGPQIPARQEVAQRLETHGDVRHATVEGRHVHEDSTSDVQLARFGGESERDDFGVACDAGEHHLIQEGHGLVPASGSTGPVACGHAPGYVQQQPDDRPVGNRP